MLEKLSSLFGVSINYMESNTIDKPILSVAIRASDLSIEDLEAISAINCIALNSEYIADILKD